MGEASLSFFLKLPEGIQADRSRPKRVRCNEEVKKFTRPAIASCNIALVLPLVYSHKSTADNEKSDEGKRKKK